MKCDDFLTVISSGGAVARFRARIHAAHCEACTAELVRFESLRDALSRTSEVTETHRALWARAAGQFSPDVQPASRSFGTWRQVRWALTTAAVLMVAAYSLLVSLNEWRPAEVAVKQIENVAPQETAEQQNVPTLRKLEQSLDKLSEELQLLGRQAELLDARRELDRLTTDYQPLGPANSPVTTN